MKKKMKREVEMVNSIWAHTVAKWNAQLEIKDE